MSRNTTVSRHRPPSSRREMDASAGNSSPERRAPKISCRSPIRLATSRASRNDPTWPLCLVRNLAGIRRSSGWPSISASGQPKISSAPRLKWTTRCASSMVMIASAAIARMPAYFCSDARRSRSIAARVRASRPTARKPRTAATRPSPDNPTAASSSGVGAPGALCDVTAMIDSAHPAARMTGAASRLRRDEKSRRSEVGLCIASRSPDTDQKIRRFTYRRGFFRMSSSSACSWIISESA